jgi:hypothetical protein
LNPPTRYDAAWKVTLETFLPACLELMFPEFASVIDWSVAPVFLDTELQKILPDSAAGVLWVDKLIRVRRMDGSAELFLIHVEVQSQRDDDLPRRMFRYFSRILDHFDQLPVSLAILADPNPSWRPGPYEYRFGSGSLVFQCCTCKLAELDLEPLIATGNPVARVIQAHRLAQGTSGNPKARRSGKLGLVRQLLESGMTDEEVREVMRTIHWLLALPEGEELGFRKDVKEMEASMQTKERSPYERIVWNEGLETGRAEGRVEGRLTAAREMLLEMIQARFGPCKEAFRARIEAIQDEGQLWQLARAVLSVSSPAELETRFPG